MRLIKWLIDGYQARRAEAVAGTAKDVEVFGCFWDDKDEITGSIRVGLPLAIQDLFSRGHHTGLHLSVGRGHERWEALMYARVSSLYLEVHKAVPWLIRLWPSITQDPPMCLLNFSLIDDGVSLTLLGKRWSKSVHELLKPHLFFMEQIHPHWHNVERDKEFLGERYHYIFDFSVDDETYRIVDTRMLMRYVPKIAPWIDWRRVPCHRWALFIKDDTYEEGWRPLRSGGVWESSLGEGSPHNPCAALVGYVISLTLGDGVGDEQWYARQPLSMQKQDEDDGDEDGEPRKVDTTYPKSTTPLAAPWARGACCGEGSP